MLRVQNITDEPYQRHIVLMGEMEIVVNLRFYPRAQIWCLDVEREDWRVYGIKLTLGCLHIRSQNQPFDFVVQDVSGGGIDPFQLDDFSTGRCVLYMLEPEDMADIRGDNVKV